MMESPEVGVLGFDDSPGFEALVDRASLQELLEGAASLFQLPLTLFSEQGLLGKAGEESRLYRELSRTREGGPLLARLRRELRAVDPGSSGELLYSCFSGASFQVSLVGYQGRRIGRLLVGPFQDAKQSGSEPTATVQRLLGEGVAQECFALLPRVRPESVRAVARHLVRTLGVVAFAGHRCRLTEQAHLHSLRENSREQARRSLEWEQERVAWAERDQSRYPLVAGALARAIRAVGAVRSAAEGATSDGALPPAVEACLRQVERELADLREASTALSVRGALLPLNRFAALLEALVRAPGAPPAIAFEHSDPGDGRAQLPETLLAPLAAFIRRAALATSAGIKVAVDWVPGDEASAGLVLLGAPPPTARVRLIALGAADAAADLPLRSPWGPRPHEELDLDLELLLLRDVLGRQQGQVEPLAEPSQGPGGTAEPLRGWVVTFGNLPP